MVENSSPAGSAHTTDLETLRKAVDRLFTEAFGRTPLRERLHDVLSQALALSRDTNLTRLQEEAGDLLCSLLQLCTECDWDPGEQVGATLRKIEARSLQYATL